MGAPKMKKKVFEYSNHAWPSPNLLSVDFLYSFISIFRLDFSFSLCTSILVSIPVCTFASRKYCCYYLLSFQFFAWQVENTVDAVSQMTNNSRYLRCSTDDKGIR